MKQRHRHIAVEILSGALWIIMAICLYRSQHFANEPPILTGNIMMISLGILLAIGRLLTWIYVGYYMRHALFDKTLVTDGPFKYVRHLGVPRNPPHAHWNRASILLASLVCGDACVRSDLVSGRQGRGETDDRATWINISRLQRTNQDVYTEDINEGVIKWNYYQK